MPRRASARPTPRVIVLPLSAACALAAQYQRGAWRSLESGAPLAAYNTAVGGLGANGDCGEPAAHLFNEAFLYAARAPAEFLLRIGDWRADLGRSDDLLRRCLVQNGLRGTPAESQCRDQLRSNEAARARMVAAPTMRPTPPA